MLHKLKWKVFVSTLKWKFKFPHLNGKCGALRAPYSAGGGLIGTTSLQRHWQHLLWEEKVRSLSATALLSVAHKARQKTNSDSSPWKIHLPEPSRQEQEWDCTTPQGATNSLLDRWQHSRIWKLAVFHISSIVPTWVHHSPTLLFEEADGTDEIPVHGLGEGNGVWC